MRGRDRDRERGWKREGDTHTQRDIEKQQRDTERQTHTHTHRLYLLKNLQCVYSPINTISILCDSFYISENSLFCPPEHHVFNSRLETNWNHIRLITPPAPRSHQLLINLN